MMETLQLLTTMHNRARVDEAAHLPIASSASASAASTSASLASENSNILEDLQKLTAANTAALKNLRQTHMD